MKALRFLLLISLCFYFTNSFLTRERYEEIKSNVPFKVLEYESFLEIFGDSKPEDFSKHNATNHLVSQEDLSKLNIQSQENIFLDTVQDNKIELPEYFDWRNIYPRCFYPPRSQGTCGSCYSFSASFALESRFCIKSRGAFPLRLSMQDIISCDSKNRKCFGDTIVNTWDYLENYGTCNYDCKPYISKDLYVPSCKFTCVNKFEIFARYRAMKGSFWASGDQQVIKDNLMKYGPLSVTMQTYEDMHLFNSDDVYEHKYGKLGDFHAVNIIGWGRDRSRNREYWIVRNSWGEKWGDQGYFKAYFGDLKIDEFACGSLPMMD